MSKVSLATGLGLIAVIALGSPPASALSSRTYVSGNGSDSNSCGHDTPCRTFQVAHDATSAGGEITILDPAGYGFVNITKSISIINDGVGEAGMIQGGITINAGSTDIIVLRGLTINGQAAGIYGIEFISGGQLNIENCVVRNFASDGVYIHPSGSGTTSIIIINTIVANNAGSGFDITPGSTGAFNLNIADTIMANNAFAGITMQPSAGGTGAITAKLKRVEATGSEIGFQILSASTGSGITATIADSVASNNIDIGVEAATNGASAKVMLVDSQVVNNVTGLFSLNAAATMLLAGNTITGNTTAAFTSQNGGVFNSFGNNYIKDNPGGDGGTITTVATK